MFRCITEKADFKHGQEDHKSNDNDILQMINFSFNSDKVYWWSILDQSFIGIELNLINNKLMGKQKTKKKFRNLNQGP